MKRCLEHICRNPRPLITWERAAATILGGIDVYHFSSGIYIRTVVRKYFIRVKYHAFIILNTWEIPKFQVHTFFIGINPILFK
ncbi:hypothetical protein HanHA300_Chr07g0248221 [Helianthus annuus]|nr:hypothetical protein HanHA300_Chr07g0248221 [Helianthus annuus]KAJ0563603.1 hypothetical protein HanHA89_Chr07g0264971 [Helianthus annuus]KAJ0728938.1 hypothetical protein HanLR1_Chr07g0247311 [Helianthus annuus]